MSRKIFATMFTLPVLVFVFTLYGTCMRKELHRPLLGWWLGSHSKFFSIRWPPKSRLSIRRANSPAATNLRFGGRGFVARRQVHGIPPNKSLPVKLGRPNSGVRPFTMVTPLTNRPSSYGATMVSNGVPPTIGNDNKVIADCIGRN